MERRCPLETVAAGRDLGNAPEAAEDEYSYPPEARGLTLDDMLAMGIQPAAPSKRRGATTKVYGATPLSDEAIARCRAKARAAMARKE